MTGRTEDGLRESLGRLCEDRDQPQWVAEYQGWVSTDDLRALLAAHPAPPAAPEATEVEEWGVRDVGTGNDTATFNRRGADNWLEWLAEEYPDQPAVLVRRTRTTYADTVTPWVEVES